MKKNLLVLCVFILSWGTLSSQHVYVEGNKFQVNGNDIFFNAISGPWQWRADCDINFMRRNFDWSYWNQEFQRYADNNIRSEERRVGKECRSRRATDDEKKK